MLTTMLEIEAPIPLAKKIQALALLTGSDPAEFNDFLVNLLEKSVTSALVSSIFESSPEDEKYIILGNRGMPEPVLKSVPPRIETTLLSQQHGTIDDVTGMASGLGDEEPAEEEVAAAQERPKSAKPKRAPRKTRGVRQAAVAQPVLPAENLTESALDGDMEVADPEHEAVGEAPQIADHSVEENGEELFASVAGFGSYVDPRVARRQKAVTARVRVSGFTEKSGEESTF